MSLALNVGNADRIIRLLLGALLIALPVFFSSPVWENPVLRIGSVVVGVVLIATALIRFCPLYRILGASTFQKL